ncbi:MAG: hypothetical protein ACD_39C00095G0007 [uncultured bacterium]|nr:MAG: hypothetical protein ACD_39C00095G0007 [uncultured bacterium]
MFQQLVNHNADVRQLVEKGYAIALDRNQYIIVRDIPYLDKDRNLSIGAFVIKFNDVGQGRIMPTDHQIFFAGSVPYGLNGQPITNLGGGPVTLSLSEVSSDITVQRRFSNKPRVSGKFKDFSHMVESYASIISGPAIELHNANPLTFRKVATGKENSVFKVSDTLSSRAEICDLSAKFNDDVIAIIGLGGTGSYLLDFLVKTPVKEIRAFDLDRFYVHNAFRSPGKYEQSEMNKSKAEVYQMRYENFRTGLNIKSRLIDDTCFEELEGVTFAFVCVDKGSSRASIFDLLISKNIPFIDVGMGIHRRAGALSGMLRATHYSSENAQVMRAKNLAPTHDEEADLYKTNIQIAELNALNACFAVIKFKQCRGFYFEEVPQTHLLFGVEDLKVYYGENPDKN